MKRAASVHQILSTKIEQIPFEGDFYNVFGHPQYKGRWLVWGNSSSGKSSFLMQLIKQFATTQKTLLLSLEEGLEDENLQDRLRLFCMHDVAHNFLITEDTLEELQDRLDRRNSPQVVVIDSAPYFFLGYTFTDYLNFTRKYPKKLFVFVAHASGTVPKTELENRMMYDATQKVFVSGYVATNKGRKFGKKTQFIVWKQGYENLHGKRSDE